MKRSTLTAIVFLLFVLSLLPVEQGPWSSKEVAKYNHGYGTFDMKSYTPDIVYQVLDQMESRGFDTYKKYFIADSIFTVIFCIFQVLLQSQVYRWSKSKLLHGVLILLPLARMICDLFENTALYHVLQEYPQRQDTLVRFTSFVTHTKLSLVGLWMLLLITGYVISYIKRHQPVKA